MDTHKRRQLISALIVVIIVGASFSVFFAYQLFKPVPAYEFKTGVNHPQEINNLLKNGTVVLYLSSNDENWCQPCGEMTPKIANLQSQYTDVKFLRFNYDDNSTSAAIFENYGISYVPAIMVIRSDGAVAKFVGETDISPIKSTIDEARQWKQPNIFGF